LEDRGLALARFAQPTVVARLATFFPCEMPARLPVWLIRGTNLATGASETSVIEFGTLEEVRFSPALPLEFAKTLRRQNSDRSLDAQVSVGAVQHHQGRTAVAARFVHHVPDWIVQPCLS
jgi:hypothetical protein